LDIDYFLEYERNLAVMVINAGERFDAFFEFFGDHNNLLRVLILSHKVFLITLLVFQEYPYAKSS
jgi:hypothetical protein